MQNELPQDSFLCISKTTTTLDFFFFGGYIVLGRKFQKPLLQKSETKISKPKVFRKTLVQSEREKKSGILRLNKIKSKLLTVSKCLQLNC